MHLKSLFGQTDLTRGRIWKTILRFSIPILISYLLQTLYTMADAAICGHTLQASEVAGVNDTSPISFIFLQFAFGCTAGMSVIISNHVGKNDWDSARKAFAMQIVLSAAIVAVLTAVSLLTVKPLLSLLGVAPSSDPVSNDVYRAAFTYIAIICGGMAGQFFYNAICCVLRSVGDSFTPLVFLLISTLLNIGLDLLFILCFGWGVAGAAIATVVSQCVSAVGCFIYTFAHYKQLRLHRSDFKAMTLRGAFSALWQGVPLGLQFSVLAFGLITMQNGVISFDKTPAGTMVDGTPAQIGYSAACKLGNLLYTPLNALGTAMLSFCGQNYGAGNRERIKRGTGQAAIMMLVAYGIVLAVGLTLSVGGAYQYIFLARDKITADTIRLGNIYLYSAVPFFIFVGGIFLMRNVVQGLGKPLFPFLAGIAELIARIVICAFVPPLVNGGPIDCNASTAAFFWLGFGDAGAWIAADIPLLFALLYYFFRMKKNAPTAPESALPDASVTIAAPQADGAERPADDAHEQVTDRS